VFSMTEETEVEFIGAPPVTMVGATVSC
jgi:hypothetical protein